MKLRSRIRRGLVLATMSGTLFASGCLGALQNSLNIILSPDAVSNALVAPYSRGIVNTLALFFARLGF